jgi:hypothetical protein
MSWQPPRYASAMQSLHARTWLAVKGKSADTCCRDLGLRAGMAVTRPRRFALEGARSDAGWYLIVAEGLDHRLIQAPVLTKLSADCEVLTCTVEERNLFSAATGWRRGRRVWSVTYDGEERPGDVVVEGDVPPSFAAIREDLTARSRAEDAGDLLLDPLFEIPIETVRHTVGYRPDQPSPAFDGRFVLLEAVDPTIWQRLFGG